MAAINGILGGDELAATSGVHGQNDMTLENEINFNFFPTWVGRNRDHFTSSWYKPALSTYLFRKGAASKYFMQWNTAGLEVSRSCEVSYSIWSNNGGTTTSIRLPRRDGGGNGDSSDHEYFIDILACMALHACPAA